LRFRFKTRKLEALYTEEKGARRFPPGVVDAFFEAMAIIDSAVDERDLYAFKGLRFEKLGGNRKGQHSIRLNRQFRLILAFERDSEGKLLLVIDIEDYH
jgi:proteic killer suppression protein